MTKVKLDLGNIVSYYAKKLFYGQNKSLEILLEELKRLTPEDTKEMLSSYIIEGPKREGLRVVGSVKNTAPHAIFVEYGRNKKGLTNKYHKPKGRVFYEGIGNRTFARATDNVKNIIDAKILEAIDS